MKKKLGLFIVAMLLIPLNAKAENIFINLNCPSSVKAGEKAKCVLNIDPNGHTLNSISANYNIPDGVTYDSFESSSSLNNIGGTLGFRFEGEFKTPITLGMLNVLLPSDGISNSQYTISLVNVNAQEASNLYTLSDVSSTIRIKSSENRLSSLSISGGSIDFNSDTLNYTTTINSDSAVISATKIDSNSTLDGNIGTVSLNYGTNTFKINVTSEIGEAKTYTINVTRPDDRNSNNNLSSLIVTNTNISFDKNKTSYDLTTTASETQISATREDSKSAIVGSTGKFDLNYGLNTFSIKVVAENGSVKEYTINITRQDIRSDNNYLKTLSLNKGTLKFSKNTTLYNVDVDNDVEKISISATLDDSKASFVSGFEPRNINLNLGNNTVYIKVQNEKGEVRTYTLNINRNDGRDSDATLKEIILSEGKIEFTPDVLEYKVNVEYSVETFKIEALPNVDKSKVTIVGDENLKVGENIFTITVEAENGKKTDYIITVIRKEEGEKVSTNNYIKSITIKNHSIDFSKNVYKYTVKTKEVKLDLSIILDDDKSEYIVTGNKNLKDGSQITIKVTAESGDVRTYIIDIEKSSNMLIITIIILITIIAVGLVTIIILKRKKRNNDIEKVLIKESENKLNDISKEYNEDSKSDDVIFTDEDFTEFQ